MQSEMIQTPAVPTSPRAFLRWFAAVPLRRRTWANLAYLVLAFPLGIAYFTILLTGFVIGGVLVVLVVGVALLVAMVYVVRELTAFERWLADTLTSVDVPTRAEPIPSDPTDNLRHAVLDLRTWTGLAYLVSKLAIGLGVFVALVFMAAFSLAFMIVPFNYRNVRVGLFPPGGDVSLTPSIAFELQTWQIGLSVPFRLTTWYVNSLPEALVVASFGVVLAFLSLHLCNVVAWLLGVYANLLLRDSDRSALRTFLDA